MKKNLVLMLMFLSVMVFGLETVSAQFTISIPKLPKIKKEKPSPPAAPTDNTSPTNNSSSNGQSNTSPSNNQQPEPPKQSPSPPENEDKYANSPGFNFHVDKIKEWTKMVDEYNSDKIYLVPTSNDNYLWYAVSAQAREEWIKNMKVSDIRQTPNNRLDAALDALKVAAAKKLPSYLPETKNYPFKNAVEEGLMKSKINRLADHKILYIGLQHANWVIDKNDFGIPTARYKRGMVWVRVARHDYPYCWVYYINVIQDYAGGGRYGASYGNYVGDELFGCPAGVK